MILPFCTAFCGTKRKELFQFENIELEWKGIMEKYILMLRDKYRSYCRFIFFQERVPESRVTAIVDCLTALSVLNVLISDDPTNFKDEKVYLMTKRLKVCLTSLMYWSSSNDAVKRLG